LIGQNSRFAPCSPGLHAGLGRVAALRDRHPALASATRAAINAVAVGGDADTADLLTGTSRVLDKALCVLDGYLD